MIHRFYTESALSLGEVTVEGLQIAHQLSKVLRVKPGETVIFFNDDGYDYTAEIIYCAKEEVRVLIKEKNENTREVTITILVVFALIKKDLIEWVLEKCTEIGVGSFHLMTTEFSLEREINIERAKRIMKEASEQSGRAKIPTLHDPITFENAISLSNPDTGILMHLGEKDDDDFLKILQKFKKQNIKEISLFIGPEGGFSDDEKAFAKKAGFSICTALPTTLRAETAAIVFSGIVASFF